MPTRRGYARRQQQKKNDEPSAAGTAIKNFGEAVAKATYTAGKPIVDKTKQVVKGGLESYLKGTQKAADYIESKIPESMKPKPYSPRGGYRRRGPGRRPMKRLDSN